MTRALPLHLLTNEELAVKQARNQLELDLLDSTPLDVLRQHGTEGLDEAVFIAASRYVPFRARHARDSREQLLERLEQEASRRAVDGRLSLDAHTQRVLDARPNPATFNVLTAVDDALRRERLVNMRDEGERLSIGERVSASYGVLESAVASVYDRLEASVSFLRRNMILAIGISGLLGAGVSGIRWGAHQQFYEAVAQEYDAGAPYAPATRRMKREAVDLGEEALWHLTEWDEIVIDLGDDGEFVIPEGVARPQLARSRVQEASRIVDYSVDDILNRIGSMSESERRALRSMGDKISGQYESIISSLTLAFDPHGNYGGEQSAITSTHRSIAQATSMVENHMHQDLVNRENQAHGRMKFFKYLTFVLGGIGGLFTWNGMREQRTQRGYGRHY